MIHQLQFEDSDSRKSYSDTNASRALTDKRYTIVGHKHAASINQNYTELYVVVNQDQHGHCVHGNCAEMMFSNHLNIYMICPDLLLTEVTLTDLPDCRASHQVLTPDLVFGLCIATDAKNGVKLSMQVHESYLS